ncbi:MAG: P-loop NTPase [Clostridia bacterium]|nr:P-loop NTPase [Clostridia bacterium]
MAGQKIIVASSKGGVGKTTVSLGVAEALTSLGKTVLLCDLDFENRCLDLFMGIENAAFYNVADIVLSDVPPEKAVIGNGRGLYFLAAPAGVGLSETKKDGSVTTDELTDALKKTVDVFDVDFVIFDTGTGKAVPLALAGAFPGSKALVVASHQAASTRAAESTASLLEKHGVIEARLVISSYEPKEAAKQERSGLIDIIDSSRVRLIGVIPYDRSLMLSHERGVKPSPDSPAAAAFRNTAARICGKSVRLFDGIPSVNRKKII